MRIAIIGAGISGLTTAYLLNKKHDITVFEKNDYIGGHTHTHDIDMDGKTFSVDSGFIVYNENTYPNFIKLLDRLGVESQLSSMGFSVKAIGKNLEYAGNSLSALFAQRSNFFKPSFFRMIRGILNFNRQAEFDLAKFSPDTTLEEYLEKKGHSREFIENYIVPMGAAIWSTKPSDMLKMPVVFFIKFFKNHGLLQIKDRPKWWVIKGGSKYYVEKLIENFKDKIKVSTPIRTIKRTDEIIEILYGTDSLISESFDAVILATHSDQALKILDQPTSKEKEILGALPYQKNEALLHFDDSILPSRRSAWSSWNYLLDEDKDKPVALTYNMNILQSLESEHTFCVTLNSDNVVDPRKIIKKLNYEHPLFTLEGIRVQNRKKEISGENRTFYCGAYWRNGFHEDGVVSALDVCREFGETL
jgi:predicted NAD/FAD-binding protein